MDLNLDVLRAFAVLFVLGNHVFNVFYPDMSQNNFVRLGHLGVLLFFVHTSLVLMRSLMRSSTQAGWVKRFYIQRFFRIYPLSIAVVIMVLSLHIPRAPHEQFQGHSWSELVANLLLVQNFVPGDGILGTLWSLPHEVQLYLLLPGIFLLLNLRSRSTWLVVLILLAFAATRLSYTRSEEVVPLQYLPCFMGGVVAWFIGRDSCPLLPSWCWPLALILFSAVYQTLYLNCQNGRLQWLVQWSFCLVLGAAQPWFSELKPSWFTKAARKIAAYSYSIYLLHYPLLWLCFVKAPLSMPLRIISFIVLLPLVCALAHYFLEQPLKHWAEERARPPQTNHRAEGAVLKLEAA
jgi:peptidoglycan/LPS O-acetylase OafA/YrhL